MDNIPPKYQVQHTKLKNEFELTDSIYQQRLKDLEAEPDNKNSKRLAESAINKAKAAQLKLVDLENRITHEAETAENLRKQAEAHMQEILRKLEEQFGVGGWMELTETRGEPIYLTPRGKKLNDAFWGSALTRNRTTLYSPIYKDFFEYNPRTGLWSPLSSELLTSQLHDLVVKLDKNVFRENPNGVCSTEAWRHAAVDSQKGILENKTAFVEHNRRHAQVANGVIEFKDGKIIKKGFDHKYYSLYASPVNYVEGADCPKFKEILKTVSEDDQSVLQRAAGQFIVGTNLCQKIFINEGQHNSSKSTLAEIFAGIVGIRAITELRTEHLNERFEMFRIHDKSLLIGADVSHDFLLQDSAHHLKKLVGGDLVTAEKKNSNETFSFSGDKNILITSNSKLILRLYSDAGAWKRRLVIVEFPTSRPVEENIPNYSAKLIEEEGAGILNWMLEGARLLYQDIEAGRGFVLTDEQRARVEDRINESDSLSIFLLAHVQSASPVASLTCNEILEEYSAYCRARKWGQPGEHSIFQRLTELIPQLFGGVHSNKIKRRLTGNFVRGYTSVCWTGDHYDYKRAAEEEERGLQATIVATPLLRRLQGMN